MRKIWLTFLIALACLSQVNAQSYLDSRYSLSIGMGRQKIGTPLVELLAFPGHSSWFVEGIRYYGKSQPGSIFQSLSVYSFTNPSAGSGYVLQSHLGKSFPFGRNLEIAPAIGIGMNHRFHPKTIFSLENGTYELAEDLGRVRPEASFRFTLGYRSSSVLVYVAYQLSAEYDYSPSTPVIPVNYLHFGIRYAFKNKAL